MNTIKTQFILLLVFLLFLTAIIPAFAQRGGRDRGNSDSQSKDSSYSPWSRSSSSPRPTYSRSSEGSSSRQSFTKPAPSTTNPVPAFTRPSAGSSPKPTSAPPMILRPSQPEKPPVVQQLPQQTKPQFPNGGFVRPAPQKPIADAGSTIGTDRIPKFPTTQRPESKPARPEGRPDDRPDRPRPEGRPDDRPDRPRPEGRPDDRPDRPRPEGRPDNRPDRPRPEGRPDNRPDRPRPEGRPDNRPDRPRPEGRPDDRPDRPRPEGRPDNRPDRPRPEGRPDNRPDRPGYHPPRPVGPSPSVINYYRRNFTGYHSYWTPDWYHRHSTLWNPVWIPYRSWWMRPAWNTTWGWFAPGFFTGVAVGNALNPYYYNYGSNIIYSGGMVYVNGVPYVSASEYYRQALELANTNTLVIQQEPVVAERVIEKEVPVIVEKEVQVIVEKEVAAKPALPADDKNSEWLPMGTFAFTDAAADNEAAPDKSRIIQLASDKKGRIRGNYVDEDKNETRQVIGAVDPKTQRVALKFTDDDKTVMECGLWNLTQDSVPILVHKGEDNTKNEMLIRLTPPEDGEENDAGESMETEEELAP